MAIKKSKKAARGTAPAFRPETTTDRFLRIHRGLGSLFVKKGEDYGSEDDPLANVRASLEFDVDPVRAVFVRMNDKWARVRQFAHRGYLANEPVTDSLRDIAVYAVIALVLLEEQKEAEG